MHNTQMYDHVQKSVLRAGWRYYPKHLWSPCNQNVEATSGHALRFLAAPSLLTLTPAAVAALRG